MDQPASFQPTVKATVILVQIYFFSLCVGLYLEVALSEARLVLVKLILGSHVLRFVPCRKSE